MPAPSRKRFSAFDDFPGNEGQDQPAPVPEPRPLVQAMAPAVERIERLKPSQMMPDRFQPRRLLPAVLRQPFYSGQITCYQAAEKWLAIAHEDSGHAQGIERLRAMGSSFQEHGQIKPITGSWTTAPDGHYIFQIETGERRFWAACLEAVLHHKSEEPLLRVEVIGTPTRQRQVLENRHAEPPSAVGQACEVSSLILAEMGLQPGPNVQDEFDFFRSARSQRMPAGLWEKVMPIMQLTRPRMVQLLNILQLPTPLLELADRYRVPERVLREVLTLPAERWEQTLLSSIQNNLTSDEIHENVQSTQPAPTSHSRTPIYPDPSRRAASSLRRFAAVMAEFDEFGQAQALDEIADLLVISGQAEGLMNLMGELSRLVNVRLAANPEKKRKK